MADEERVGVYIDGFNVYHGMVRKNWRRYLWLDYRALFESMLRPDQELAVVRYFTAFSKDPGSRSGDSMGGDALVDAAGGNQFHLDRRVWARCQLPDVMQREPGTSRIRRPPEWS